MDDIKTNFEALKNAGGSLYFIGIAGTGMAAVAGYFKECGYRVFGSDQAVYPPMSEMLNKIGITFFEGFAAEHLIEAKPSMVIIGNRISTDNPEVEFTVQSGIPYTSFPRLLNNAVLQDKISLVVAGTHGKTTTTSLLAHVLDSIGDDPHFIVGGIPLNYSRNFRVGNSDLFCIEGDEYGSAFFAKEPKFLHYCPNYLLLNSIELDHADIYSNLQEVMDQFAKLVSLVEDPTCIVANTDCPNVANLIAKHKIKCVTVSPYRKNKRADVVVLNYPPITQQLELQTSAYGQSQLKTLLFGSYNAANIAMVVGTMIAMQKNNLSAIEAGLSSFKGVKKRLQHLFSELEVDCYEDFAHHPTAVRLVLGNLKKMHPQRRLLAVFDPRSASSKRNIFFNEYAKNLRHADVVALRKCESDARIPPAERMDTSALATKIGAKAKAFTDDTKLGQFILEELRSGDVLVFMSCSSYNDLPDAAKHWVQSGYHLRASN